MDRRVAVITGGTRGLGKELVRAFHRKGYRIAANYLSSHDEARTLAEEVGDDILIMQADVSSASDLKKMAEEVSHRFGRVDVLVNNAGVTKDSLLARQQEKDWDRLMAVNLTGTFHAVRAFLPLMGKEGHIINISSYSGLKGKEGQAAYSASKAALIGFTKTAAIELAEQGIRINAVLPGYMATEMGAMAAAALERAKGDSLLHSLSDPQEAAEFIAHIAGTRNITGQVFAIESRII
ncbi:MAG: SDR family NAD(P)-dependent oxidoreductase [Thermodesulfovibrionales bacterium]|jgi:3-oxoacyl-[acyl-carrier protein] reductase